MRLLAAILAGLALAPAPCAADDLPPETLLLSRIKRHMRGELARLPDYTCLETSQRFQKAAGSRSAMKSLDTVRLEVLYTGQHELFAAPGGRDFQEDKPSAFSGGGLSASGLFATFLHTLFVNDNGMFTWRGEVADQPGGEVLNVMGRRTVRYDFRVPVLTSGWHMRVGDVADTVAMKGAIWVDADSLDLLRLKVQADDVPATMDLAEATIILDYARTRIGAVDVMLPQTGEVSMLHQTGGGSRNVLEYTHCRSFQAQSTLSFDAPAAGAAPAAAPAAPRAAAARTLTLPADLDVRIKLAAAISEKDTVGTLIAGIVAGDVVDKGKVLIPSGATVSGRIRRLERNDDSGGYFVFGVEFTEIHSAGSAFRFYADLQDMDQHPDIGWALIDNGKIAMTRERISTTDLPGVGTFFIRGTRFTLPAGFRLVWKTRPLAR